MGLIMDKLNDRRGCGNFVILVGETDSGKTTVLCNIFKEALENDFEIITTTKIFSPPKRIHVVNSASGLFRAYAHTQGKIIIAIDDAQAYFDSTSMASTKASKINQVLYIFMAKMDADFIFVAHYIQKVPSPIWEHNPLIVWAIKPGIMKIHERRFIVPRSPFKFPKNYIPSWEWDIDAKALHHRLSDIGGDTNEEIIDNNKQVILEFLSDPEESELPKKKQAELLLKLFNEDMGKEKKITQKYLAQKLDVDPVFITRIKKSLY